MPLFWSDGTSWASSPSKPPFSSVNSSPRNVSLVPLSTLPVSLVINVFRIETFCHSPSVRSFPPAGLGAAVACCAAGALVGAGAAVGLAAAAGAVVGGGLVGLAAGGCLAAGGAVGAGAHAPSSPRPSTPKVAPTRASRSRRRNAPPGLVRGSSGPIRVMLVLLPQVHEGTPRQHVMPAAHREHGCLVPRQHVRSHGIRGKHDVVVVESRIASGGFDAPLAHDADNDDRLDTV